MGSKVVIYVFKCICLLLVIGWKYINRIISIYVKVVVILSIVNLSFMMSNWGFVLWSFMLGWLSWY